MPDRIDRQTTTYNNFGSTIAGRKVKMPLTVMSRGLTLCSEVIWSWRVTVNMGCLTYKPYLVSVEEALYLKK